MANRSSRWLLCSITLSLAVLTGCRRDQAATSPDGPVQSETPRTPAADYGGVWVSGQAGGPLRVEEITISKNEFPCAGSIAILRQQGNVIADVAVVWEKRADGLVGLLAEKDGKVSARREEVAQVSLSKGTLSGKVFERFFASGERELQVLGLKKK